MKHVSDTLRTARDLVRDYQNGAFDDYDMSHMRPGEFEARLVDACETLEDRGDEADMILVDWMIEHAPAVFDWASNGAWVGSVAYENGWTA